MGIGTGLFQEELTLKGAEFVSSLFMNFLKLIATPIVFLSIFSAFLNMRDFSEMKLLGKKVFFYTIVTTIMAATIALILFLIADPAKGFLHRADSATGITQQKSYATFLLNIVPANFVQAFLENNVIGIAFIAFLLGIGSLKLPQEHRQPLTQFFSSLFQLVLKITQFVIFLLPVGIWAFTTLLIDEVRQNANRFNELLIYLGIVLGANCIQGFLVLPLLLKVKKLSPWKMAKGGSKALILAFFSKSSNATLPVTLQCAEKHLGINPRTAQFSLPLCTVINMNGCAAFILTTVLFVSELHGVSFSPLDLIFWVFLATLAAIGNAGVPMGCFFLSSTFLISMHVPITTMGFILPFYGLLDMVETALNVWSDISVTAIVDKELKTQETLQTDFAALVSQKIRQEDTYTTHR